MYVLQQPERAPRYVVSAELWNELFHLLTAQGNHTAEAVKTLIDKLKIELWGLEAAQFITNASTMPSEAGTNVASQLLWLNNTIAQHKTSSDHDTRYYTKDQLTRIFRVSPPRLLLKYSQSLAAIMGMVRLLTTTAQQILWANSQPKDIRYLL